MSENDRVPGPSSQSDGQNADTIETELRETLTAALANDSNADIGPALERIVASARITSGPLPPPEVLKVYKEILPELPAALMEAFLLEQRSRQNFREHRFNVHARYATLGLVSGWTIALGALGLSAYFGTIGHTEAAIAALGVSVLGVVGKLVEQRLGRPKDVED